MKKIFLPILAASLFLASCDILDKEPLTTISPTTYFQSAEDAEAGLTGAYDGLQATGLYSQDLIVMGEMPSDNCTSTNGDVLAMEQLTWNTTTSQLNNYYRDAYRGINRANAVLKYVPGITMNDTRKNEILGEARFLRALYYFNLVRAFGGVPLRLEPTESGAPDVLNLPRATADEIYGQVVADLTDAVNTMPASNSRRAAKGAANALLSRVHLTRRQWSQAQAAANAVITSGSYTLASNFKALFPADNNAESILEVQNSGTADGNNLLPDLLLPSPPATYSFPKFNIPTDELIEYADTATYTAGGTRQTDRRWSRLNTTTVTVGNITYVRRDHGSFVLSSSANPRASANDLGAFVYKWPGPPNAFNSPDNTYILRLGEVLLNYAEAVNEQTGPSTDVLDKLNRVRQRAGLSALTAASPQYASKQAMRNEIDRQRRLELAFEGERWFDLLRYARHNQAEAGAHTVTALDIIRVRRNSADVNYLLFPIPQNELNTNPLIEQNPGY